MSCKIPVNSLNSSFKANCDSQWIKAPSLDANVKFAGEEAKDRLYEPKQRKKLVRVLTVIAYVFFVSLAAIMLSLYYVFLWNGNQKENVRIRASVIPSPRCDHEIMQMRMPDGYENDVEVLSSSSATTEELSWQDVQRSVEFEDELNNLTKRSLLIKKIIENV